jgi:predicted nucleotidyltransferase component of viral defense system
MDASDFQRDLRKLGMDSFLQKTPDERRLFIEEAARRMGRAPVVIEKDFWVCWTLGQIFSLPEVGKHMTFKGGTSLSKVYGLINRFSEDIDLSFHREFLGFGGEHDPANATGKERSRRLDALQLACAKLIGERFVPALFASMAKSLESDGWCLEVDEQDKQTVLFHYPQPVSTELSYLKPTVKIEMGARSDHWPTEDKRIESYLHQQFPIELPTVGCATVNVLMAERTFWEKATILHAECHRSLKQPAPDRNSRHYYDLARLAESSDGPKTVARLDLLKAVVEHKKVFFRSGWANYETAKPGTLRLVPPPERIVALKRDYALMQDMFFGTPPTFDIVLATLTKLEAEINRQK